MRLIDADSLFDFLTDQLDKETGAFSKGRNRGIYIARSALHDKTITPTIVPPPNDPLTLDELREMIGEPVFLTGGWGWRICYGISYFRGCLCMETGAGSGIPMMDYGKTWQAYRRKPDPSE